MIDNFYTSLYAEHCSLIRRTVANMPKVCYNNVKEAVAEDLAVLRDLAVIAEIEEGRTPDVWDAIFGELEVKFKGF